MKLTYDAEKHEYRLGNRILPSVTQILKDMGLIDSRHFDEYSATRGTYVHQACAMVDAGTLDEKSIDPALRGYVEAYQSFRSDFPGMEWNEIEAPKYDEVLGFAGTPDRVGRSGSFSAVVDLKTGTPQKWHGYQLAGYALLSQNSPLAAKRYGLYLSDDGTFKLHRYVDHSDFDAFRAALTVYKLKQGA